MTKPGTLAAIFATAGVFVVSWLLIADGNGPQGTAQTAPPQSAPSPSAALQATDRLDAIPADQWLGTPETEISGVDLRGDVVLMEFWTYLCYNCKNVEPWMKRIHAEYEPRGLRVIGIHTPEFDVERDVANVQEYIDENGIQFPVAIDNGLRVWRRYNTTHARPAFLVFDRNGNLVYRRAGEGAVDGAEEAIRKALQERAATVAGRESAAGIRLLSRADRVSPRRAIVEFTFEPEPGFRLVRSPPNEILLEPNLRLAAPGVPILHGRQFTGTDSRDVEYFEGRTTLAIPLEVTMEGPVMVRGEAVYRLCDLEAGVCSTRRRGFAVMVSA